MVVKNASELEREGFLDFEISENGWVLLKKNASETERARSFDEVKRSEVERQAAVSTPEKLTAIFRKRTPNDNRRRTQSHILFDMKNQTILLVDKNGFCQ